jgi:hypothetical protein
MIGLISLARKGTLGEMTVASPIGETLGKRNPWRYERHGPQFGRGRVEEAAWRV